MIPFRTGTMFRDVLTGRLQEKPATTFPIYLDDPAEDGESPKREIDHHTTLPTLFYVLW
jgi:hypothetical protein